MPPAFSTVRNAPATSYTSNNQSLSEGGVKINKTLSSGNAGGVTISAQP